MVRHAIIVLSAVCTLTMLAAARADKEPARLALLIANQSYAPSVGILKNPYNDIGVVGDALAHQGFTVLPPVKDANRVEILGAIRTFVSRLNEAGPGTIGFVYYSGHGAAEAQTNVNYLIPVDAKEPSTEAFWDESVKLDDVLKLISRAGEAAKFVVFDACRNELRLPYRGSKGFEPVREQPGTFVAYATAPGQPASDGGDGQKTSPYAAAFAAELGKPGLDHLHLFQRVKEAVYSATKGAQQPWESNGLFRLVYLTPVKKEFGAAPSTQPAQTATEITKPEEHLICSGPPLPDFALTIAKENGIAHAIVISNSMSVLTSKNDQQPKDAFVVYEADNSHYSAQQDTDGASEAFSSIFINRVTGELSRINRISHRAVSLLVDTCDGRITKQQCAEKMEKIPGGNLFMCLDGDLQCESRRKGNNIIRLFSYTCKAVKQQF